MFDDIFEYFSKKAFKERKKDNIRIFRILMCGPRFLMSRDLAAKLEEEVDYISKLIHREKGIKTEIINHTLAEYLNKSLAEREKG